VQLDSGSRAAAQTPAERYGHVTRCERAIRTTSGRRVVAHLHVRSGGCARCTPCARRSPRLQTGASHLAGPAVAALLNGAGEREVKKLNLLTLPVFWCLGDGPTMHEEGALPGTPGRRVRALPMTDPLVKRPRADAQPQRPRPQVLVLACRRVCWALPGRHRAGGRTRRCVLKMTRWELTTWVVFVAPSRLCGGWRPAASRFGLSYTCQGVGCR